jgi:glycosyltransferase involved in cell wall biosynthesis
LTDDHRREQVSRIFARAFRVLFVSDQNRISAERQLAEKIPNSDLVLNPVNLLDRSSVPWPESRPARFASVARLETLYKGQDVLIETLSTSQWKQRDWHLTLYGSGPDESYLRSLAHFFGLRERITFAGYLKDVRAIWSKEHVLVMLSRSEGTPLALVEAMLCGRPAIVTDVGGNQEWVTETQTGFVAEAPVVGLAGAAFERAWSARENWKETGMRAHKFAADRLSDPSIPPLLDVILEAAQQKKPFVPASAEELKRLNEFRKLTEPSLGKQAKRVAGAGVRYIRRILDRCRTPLNGR